MSRTLGSASACPIIETSETPGMHCATESGLTKRELFAALIFAGLAGCPNVGVTREWADDAVKGADSLIDALNATPT